MEDIYLFHNECIFSLFKVTVPDLGDSICVKSRRSGRGYRMYHKTQTKSHRKIKLCKCVNWKCKKVTGKEIWLL